MTSDKRAPDSSRQNFSWKALPSTVRRGPAVVASTYLFFAVLWILFSDAWVDAAFDEPALVSAAQTWKGLFFVTLTAVLLYLAMRGLYWALRRAYRELETQTDRQKHLMREVVDRESRFIEMADHVPEVFWVYDPAQEAIIYASPAFETIWQRPVSDLINTPELWLNSVHPNDYDKVIKTTRFGVEKCQPTTQEYRIQRPDGSWRWIHDRTYPILTEEGDLKRMVGVTEDITHQRFQQEALYQAAHYDRLTGLPNRSLFYERLEQQCQESGEGEVRFALLLVNLDRFRIINDSLGHSAGDDLLRQVSQRLQEVLEKRGFIARLGADEFAILLAREGDYDEHENVARDLIRALSEPYVIQGETTFVTVTVGIVIAPDDGQETEMLLRRAALAVTSAKTVGRNSYRYFDQDGVDASPERLRLETDIHQAIERGEFELYFQAQFSVEGRKVDGAECLLRWNHPTRGLVSPGEFIPLLEETGLIVPAGLWVIEEACRRIAAWRELGLPDHFVMAVNVSARQLYDAKLSEEVNRLICQYNVPRGMLELELTETSLMQEPDSARRLFQQLRSIGVKIAIDDFGTGYSSLNYLREFEPDILKIDKSFIDGIARETKDREIFFGIVRLAHTLNISVIAEGVEESSQLDVLKQAECDWVQGFLLAKPIPKQEFEEQFLNPDALSRQA